MVLKKLISIFVIILLIIFLGGVALYYFLGRDTEDRYIIHALGGMDGRSYINSIDCLEACYDAGFRLFEGDVSFTSDGVLVMAHSSENNVWSRNDWEERLGQAYPFAAEGEVPEDYNAEKHLATFQDFMNFRIQGEFKATSFGEVLDFMETHKDMYLMVDAGCRSYEDTKIYYHEIVKNAGGRTEVLDRLIVGGQTTEMVKAAKEEYDFPLVNLYYNSDEKREEIISTPEKFVAYCKENGITSFSVSSEVYTEDVARALEDSELTSYIFTVNDVEEADRFRSYGADVIGTDFLWENGDE